MTDLITLTGLVATTPRHITTSEGLAITSFRLASSQRRYDRVQQRWIDGDTNWYTVSAFRNLAQNAATSVSKGDRVVLTGRVRIRDWENTDRSGTTVEVEAESVGHDLTWGTAVYTRTTTTLSTDDAQWIPDDVAETQSATQPDSQSEAQLGAENSSAA
jgi:single-strand DNA-binding protein